MHMHKIGFFSHNIKYQHDSMVFAIITRKPDRSSGINTIRIPRCKLCLLILTQNI